MAIKQEWLSQYQHELVNQLECKFSEDSVKLVPNLLNKERYVLHYRNFKLYHELGMPITKIHRAIKFEQEAWMAPYINMNTKLRSMA